MEAFEHKKTTANPCLGRLNTSLFLVTKIAILAKCHLLVNVLYTFIHFDVNNVNLEINLALFIISEDDSFISTCGFSIKIFKKYVQISTNINHKGPQTNMPKNVGSIKT